MSVLFANLWLVIADSKIREPGVSVIVMRLGFVEPYNRGLLLQHCPSGARGKALGR